MATRYCAGDELSWQIPGHVVLQLVEHKFAGFNRKSKVFFARKNFILAPPDKHWYVVQRNKPRHRL